MISLIIQKTSKLFPIYLKRKIAFKYIAGEELKDAITVSKELNSKGAYTTIDVLGEFALNENCYESNKEDSTRVLEEINSNNLKSNLSVKLTNYGLGINNDVCYKHISELLKEAEKYNLFIWIDMENSPFTCDTINIYKKLRKNEFTNVGIVIQARLYRSKKDIESLKDCNAFVRLCKGIYKESEDISYTKHVDIEKNYIELLEYLFDNKFFVGIATHHQELIKKSKELINIKKLESGLNYEFQMLKGVNEPLRDKLIRDGHKVLIYVPFGEKWKGYTERRMKENPEIAKYVLKAIFNKKI